MFLKRILSMKDDIHPPYQKVLYIDSSTGKQFLIGSTAQPKETQTYEGKTYPVVRVPTSSASHPFFTKNKQFVDTEGRVDKFLKKYKKKTPPSKDQEESKKQ